MTKLDDLARPGTRIAVRVQPRAAQNSITRESVADGAGGAGGPQLRVRTTAPASDGAANAAVTRMLAKAIGIAPSRLVLLRGAASRNKLFRVD